MTVQPRQHPAVVYNSIKATTARLIKSCGGIECAAEDTRVSASTLSEYETPNQPNRFITADVVVDLELVSRNPILTKALCRIAGGVFLPTRINPDAPIWNQHLAMISREVADVVGRGNEMLADDNDISSKEAPDLLRDVDEAIDVLASMRAALVDKASKAER